MNTEALSFYETAADTSGYIYFEKAVCREQWHRRPHFHDSVEITVVTKGTCHVRINAEEKLLEPGTILFVDRFDVHDYQPNIGNEYYVVLISAKYLDDMNGFSKKTLPTFLYRQDAYEKIKEFLDYCYPFGVAVTVLSAWGLSTRFWACSHVTTTFVTGILNTMPELLQRH